MTNQESIERIKATQCWKFHDDDNSNECGVYLDNDGLCEDCEYHIAIECIEKQIPQKPRIEYMPLFKAYCPICEGRLLPSKWCAKCGQAIDWESDNE